MARAVVPAVGLLALLLVLLLSAAAVDGAVTGLNIRVGVDSLPLVTNGAVSQLVSTVKAVSGLPVPASVSALEMHVYGPAAATYRLYVTSDDMTVMKHPKYSIASTGTLPTSPSAVVLDFNCTADGTALLTTTWSVTIGATTTNSTYYAYKECSSVKSSCAACGTCVAAGTCTCQQTTAGSNCLARVGNIETTTIQDGKTRLLVWNTYGVGLTETVEQTEQRFNEIADYIIASGADMVALQEVFSAEVRDVLVARLLATYPYMSQQSFGNGPSRFSGLLFASRYPILRHSFEEFSASVPSSADSLTDKGIYSALVRLSEDAYAFVFNTHMQAASGAPALVRAIQTSQLRQIRSYINTAFTGISQKYPTSKVSVILAGDLNIGGTEGTSSLTYKEAMTALGDPRDLYLEKNAEVTGTESAGTCTAATQAALTAAGRPTCTLGQEVMVPTSRLDYALAFNSVEGLNAFTIKLVSATRSQPTSPSNKGLNLGTVTHALSDHPVFLFELDVAQDYTAAIAIGVTVGVVVLALAVFVGLLWIGKVTVRAPKTLETYARQTKILLTKNFLMNFRNRQALAVQLCVPIVFVAVLFLLQFAIQSNQRNRESINVLRNAAPAPVSAIPRCVVGPGQSKCYSFGYSPKGNALVDDVMNAVRIANNIPESEVISFSDPNTADEWLDANRNTTQGVYHLSPIIQSGRLVSLNYTIQYNTSIYWVRRTSVLPQEYVVRPMQMALDAELIRRQYKLSHPGAADLQVQVQTIKFPHPELVTIDVIGSSGPIFFLGCLMFNFVTQLGQLVSEKELHLRDALATMGMRTSLYWFSWMVTNMFWNLLSALLLILAGAIFQFPFFLKNDFLTYFLLFTLFGWAMVPVAFFCSLALSKARTATSLGFGIYLLGIIVQGIAPTVFIESTTGSVVILRTVLSFLPFALLAKGMSDLGSFTDGDADTGLRWSERASYAWFTLDSVYKWCIISFFTFLVLTLICDYLFVAGHGESRVSRWWHHLVRWCKSRAVRTTGSDAAVSDEAVGEEEEQVKAGKFDSEDGIQILGLRKVFAGGFVAVRNMWLHINDRQLFCLLGHNGAGKTTTLSMMVGLLQSTEGDIRVFGNGLNNMEAIQQVMGVCPQHDVLWAELTAAEHIALFAGLKGVPQDQIATEVKTRLAEVGLTHVSNKFAGLFSGGMRRRLSVAIALTGDPRVVYLDEPTTGMDPVSRRQVWDLLEAQKRKRLVVLTTHSMEEADVLSDRIAIMKQGRLHCIGTSVRLKRRFGSGFNVNILMDEDGYNSQSVSTAPVAPGDVSTTDGVDSGSTGAGALVVQDVEEDRADNALDAVKHVMTRMVPHAQFAKSERHVASFVVPTADVDSLTLLLKELEAHPRRHGVQDVQVGLTTLEDVFLTVTGHGRTEGFEAPPPVEAAEEVAVTVQSKPTANDPIGRTRFSLSGQIHALVSKSFVLQGRQKLTNAFQLVLPMLLIFGLWALQRLVDSVVAAESGEYTPAVLHTPRIAPSFFVPALDFNPSSDCPKSMRAPVVDSGVGQLLYTTNNNAALESLLGAYGPPVPGDSSQFWLSADANAVGGTPSGLLGNVTRSQLNMFGIPGETYPQQGNRQIFCFNKPRVLPISFTSVRSRADMDDILFSAWDSAPRAAAFVFDSLAESSPPAVKYSIMYNSTLTRGIDISHINGLISNALFRYFAPSSPAKASIDFAGTRSMPTSRTKNTFDLISLIGPNIYLFLYQLMFPVFLGTLVYEKEFKLRDIMRMMGLKTSVYWFVNYIVFMIMYMIATLAFELLAVGLGFRFFKTNDFGILVLFSFVWGNVVVAGAVFLSVFFTNARTATVVGYCIIFAAGIIGSSMVQILFDNVDTPAGTIFALCLVPPFAMLRGLYVFRDGVSFDSPGLRWADIGQEGAELDSVMWFLLVEWIVAMVGAWYFENVLASSGVRASPLFFLDSSYWFSKRHDESSLKPVTCDTDTPSVAKERIDVWSGSRSNDIIRIRDLAKTFPSRDGKLDTVAVANLTMGVQRGECFGMLGPNGSGKTTTINCLCGYLAPTTGTASVAGFSIHGDTDLIHLNMGVCPQDNVIWPELTGAEHLRFYGRLKDLSGKALEREVQLRLSQVELADVGNKRAGQYSGGMQRRLCVAIALMGAPPVLLLDEPTTGLDPAARRTLWSVVETAKPNCATLLTTHSMEEAEALCERVGMFVFGNMKCLGSPAALKNDLGDFYKLTVICDTSKEIAAARFITELVPTATLLNDPMGGARHYQCPRSSTTLSALISALNDNWERVGINDWAVTNVTLEEVFLKVAGTH